MRICSLTPSGTEIVCALGLADELVGVSHRCDYPPEVAGKPVVSQLLVRRETSGEIDTAIGSAAEAGHPIYELDAALVRALAPDLILTQELCEVCAVPAVLAEELARGLVREPRLISVTARTLDDILGNVERLGTLTGREAEASALLERMRQRIQRVASRAALAPARRRVAYLEWLDPPWAGGYWMPQLLALAGGEDGLGRPGQRSRKLSWPELAAYAPEVLLLAPCGFSLERTLQALSGLFARPEWSALPAVRAGRVYLLDGTLFSRYGPRVVDGLEALAGAIQPGLFPGPLPRRIIRPLSEA